jgi:hypothetical protein
MNKFKYRLSKTIIKRGTKDSFIDNIAITGNFATVSIKKAGSYDYVLNNYVKEQLIKATPDQLGLIFNQYMKGTVKRNAVN